MTDNDFGGNRRFEDLTSDEQKDAIVRLETILADMIEERIHSASVLQSEQLASDVDRVHVRHGFSSN